MKRALMILLGGAVIWLPCGGQDADAQGKREEKQRPQPHPAPAHSPPVHRPPPLAATPSLSVRPPVHSSIQPRPNFNPPAPARREIPLPSNFQRTVRQPSSPAPAARLPERKVIEHAPPREFPKVPTHASGFVSQRPGVVPGSIGIPAPAPRPREDLGKWMQLPHERQIARSRPAPVSMGTIGAADVTKKLSAAWAKRPNQANRTDVTRRKFNQQALNIQNHFQRDYRANPWFSQRWWANHPIENRPWWHYSNYWNNRPFSYWWRPATWGLVTSWLPWGWGAPSYYDYGTNVVYRDNYVYVNDVPVAPAPLYAEQAIDLANAPPPPEGAALDWMPLGVFGLATTPDEAEPSLVLQLAMSKDGLISGTYYNSATGQQDTLEGRVDPATQRVAIRFGDNGDTVLETGLYNLTQESTTVLVHFGTLSTQTWFLVRLQAPEQP